MWSGGCAGRRARREAQGALELWDTPAAEASPDPHSLSFLVRALPQPPGEPDCSWDVGATGGRPSMRLGGRGTLLELGESLQAPVNPTPSSAGRVCLCLFFKSAVFTRAPPWKGTNRRWVRRELSMLQAATRLWAQNQISGSHLLRKLSGMGRSRARRGQALSGVCWREPVLEGDPRGTSGPPPGARAAPLWKKEALPM